MPIGSPGFNKKPIVNGGNCLNKSTSTARIMGNTFYIRLDLFRGFF